MISRPQETTKAYGANRTVIAAIFLTELSELETFWCLEVLARRHCPTYFSPTLHGAHTGAALVAACLKHLDSSYFATFADRCAFPLTASFLACARPLAEVPKLWDLLFAMGPHFLIFIVVAIFRSHQRLGSAFVSTHLPDVSAAAVIPLALDIPAQLSDTLLDQIRHHLHD